MPEIGAFKGEETRIQKDGGLSARNGWRGDYVITRKGGCRTALDTCEKT